jgi:putative hydrolase of HD superfamily
MKEKDFIEFAKIIGKLKRTPRTGWKMRGVKNSESIADHSFRTVLIGMVLADLEGLDTEKVMRMLLLHDIEESITGDITTLVKEKMDKEELNNKQREAVKKALSLLPKDLRSNYLLLWNEMEEEKTVEAKFCKDIDKLEMMIQLVDYEDEDEANKKKLKEFWSREDINTPKRIETLVKIYEELKKERNVK